jgi:hypothetical protein
MRVERPVSSMKIRRSGSRSGCAANHASRDAATSGRSCSVACADFFSMSPPGGRRNATACPIRPRRRARYAGAPASRQARCRCAVLRFVLLFGEGEEEGFVHVKLRAGWTALTLSRRLSCRRGVRGPADHRGDADPIAQGRGPAGQTCAHCVQDANTQIVTVGTGHDDLPDKPQGSTLTPPQRLRDGGKRLSYDAFIQIGQTGSPPARSQAGRPASACPYGHGVVEERVTCLEEELGRRGIHLGVDVCCRVPHPNPRTESQAAPYRYSV